LIGSEQSRQVRATTNEINITARNQNIDGWPIGAFTLDILAFRETYELTAFYRNDEIDFFKLIVTELL
jgi:hypothetical protein